MTSFTLSIPVANPVNSNRCELCGSDTAETYYARVTEYHYRTQCLESFACQQRMAERDAATDAAYERWAS